VVAARLGRDLPEVLEQCSRPSASVGGSTAITATPLFAAIWTSRSRNCLSGAGDEAAEALGALAP